MVAVTFSPSITGLVGAVDVHLELGLLVLLDPERAAASIGNEDVIDPERRVGRQLERAVEAAELVGREVLGEDFFTLGIVDLDVERLAGEIGRRRADRSGRARPRT